MDCSDHHVTCKEFIDFIDDYLAGGQNDAVRETFERHIARCSCCECYLEHYRKTIEAAKRCCCNRTEPPPEVPEELIKAILAAREHA